MKIFGGIRGGKKADDLDQPLYGGENEAPDNEQQIEKLAETDMDAAIDEIIEEELGEELDAELDEELEAELDEELDEEAGEADPEADDEDGSGEEETERSSEEQAEIDELISSYQKKKKKKRIIIAAVVVALLAGLTGAYAYFVKPPEIKQPEVTKRPVPTDNAAEPDDTNVVDVEDEGDTPDAESGVKTRRDGVFTFLLVGMEQSFANTDTIMVGVLDTNEKKVNIVSIPRDTCANVPYENKKINAVYAYSGGIDGLTGAVRSITGFPIDSYVMVNVKGFEALVDTIGGVNFYVPHDMNYDDPTQNLHIHFNQGEQYLTGSDAVKVVRWRQNNNGSNYGDIVRIETQQNFLKTVIKKCMTLSNLATKLKDYVDIFKNYVTTDLTTGNLLWYGEQFLKLSSTDFNFFTIPSNYYDSIKGFSYGTIYVNDWLEMLNENFNPYEEEIMLEDLDIVSRNSWGELYATSGSISGGYSSFLDYNEFVASLYPSTETDTGSGTDSGTGSGTSGSGDGGTDTGTGGDDAGEATGETTGEEVGEATGEETGEEAGEVTGEETGEETGEGSGTDGEIPPEDGENSDGGTDAEPDGGASSPDTGSGDDAAPAEEIPAETGGETDGGGAPAEPEIPAEPDGGETPVENTAAEEEE